MLKRVGLFLVTNLLVILTIGFILNVIQYFFGIKLEGLQGLAVFCGIFGAAGAFISLSISRWIAKRAYSIQLIDRSEKNYELQNLYNMISRLSRQAGLAAVPEIGVYHSEEPNAFATGPSKKKSLVAFSSGLLKKLEPQELEAIAAHEIAHISNGDMVTMTLLTGIANAFVMFLSRIIAGVIDNFLSDDEGGGGLGFFAYIIIVMILETFFMSLASIPIAAFSRHREYRADSGSAKLTSTEAMVNALAWLSWNANIPAEKDSLAILKINSSRRTSLWSTHPSIESRIKRLQESGGIG